MSVSKKRSNFFNDRETKIQCVIKEQNQPTGKLPPPRITVQDVDGYEEEWRVWMHSARECLRRALHNKNQIARLNAERAVLESTSKDQTDEDRLQDIKNWIWIEDDDDEVFGDDFAEQYDDKCCGCNLMKDSWQRYSKKYNVEPRWRLIGTHFYFCRRCHRNVKHGKPVSIRYPNTPLTRAI